MEEILRLAYKQTFITYKLSDGRINYGNNNSMKRNQIYKFPNYGKVNLQNDLFKILMT